MKQDVKPVTGPDLATEAQAAPLSELLDMVAPALWQPRFPAESMHHLPLLFWLVAALRPERAAVAGLGEGGEFFALCQALDRVGQPGRCLGFGLGPSAGEISHRITSHAAEFYPDLASLKMLADEGVLPRPGSLDLLLINGAALPTTPREDLATPEAWLQLLARNGVLILYDMARITGLGEEWQEVAAHPAALEHETDPGLIIIPAGEALPEALAPLAFGARHGVIAGGMGALLDRLGQALQDRADQVVIAAEAAADRAVATATRKGEARLSRQLASLDSAYAARGTKLGRMQADLFEARQAQVDMTARLEAVEQAQDAALAKVEAANARAEEAAARAEAERTSRFQETAALTGEMEALHKRLAETEANLAKVQKSKPAAGKSAPDKAMLAEAERKVTAARRANDRLRAETAEMRDAEARLIVRIAELETYVAELLASTSWRITAPMRRFRDLFRSGQSGGKDHDAP